MAVSNQLRETAKKVTTPATPASASNQVKFSAPKSGLSRIGVASGQALKSKRIKSLKLAANY